MNTTHVPTATVITRGSPAAPLRSNLREAKRHSRRARERLLAELKMAQLSIQTPADPYGEYGSEPAPLCAVCNRPFRATRDACWYSVTIGYSLPVLAAGGYGYWEDIRDIYRDPLTADDLVAEYASGSHVLVHRRCLARASHRSTLAHRINLKDVDEFLSALVAAKIPCDSVRSRWAEVADIMAKVVERRELKNVLRLYATAGKLKSQLARESTRNGLIRRYGHRMAAAGLTFP